MKKRVLACGLTGIMLLFSGCGLVNDMTSDLIRESMGDEYAEIYDQAAAEQEAAMEQLEEEWAVVEDELKAEMQDEMDAAKGQLKAEWDAQKEGLREQMHNSIEENYGENAEQVKEVADAGIEFLESLFGPKWEYPVVDPKCSWGGFEEETWSWSEWEFTDPEGKGREYHLGLDLQNRDGTLDILAAADGTVVFGRDSAQKSSGNGYKVVIEHELDGVQVYSFYAHLAKTDDIPLVGTEVKQGDRIGTMGTTGTSSKKNPHLHFAVYKANQRFDPYGRAQKFSGNVKEYNNYVFYNPKYIIENDKLPE